VSSKKEEQGSAVRAVSCTKIQIVYRKELSAFGVGYNTQEGQGEKEKTGADEDKSIKGPGIKNEKVENRVKVIVKGPHMVELKSKKDAGKRGAVLNLKKDGTKEGEEIRRGRKVRKRRG